MTQYIAGLICALVLAAFMVVWFAYCMFVRERHKDEHHYNISDIIKRNTILSELEACETTEEKKSGLVAGVFILPSRHKHKEKEKEEKDDYDKRPDYPESPVPLQLSTEKLVELLNDGEKDDFYKDGTLEIGSNATYISDV
ncbi:uncharacterized protein LOC134798322 [Cydia splendana]|uniref:uncharacterized protein LOC134798322 n=1 Tax=Cydia splendana TaxID=1100963 RepID=UPI00212BD13F